MNEMLNLIEKVVAIPSCADKDPFMANRCFEIYENIFKDCRVYTQEITCCNCKSVLFSNYNTKFFDVLTVCHTDVVESEEYKMNKNGNIIYGRGVFDMKSFVIMALLNLKEIILNKTPIKYGVLIVSDEETIFENTMNYWLEEYDIKTNIVLDNDASNGNINEIIEETLGAASVRINASNIYDELETIRNINKNNRFVELKYNVMEKTHEFYFKGTTEELCKILNNCIVGKTNYLLNLIHKYNKNNINDKYHTLYKKICKQNNLEVKYITNKNTNDSRFFVNKGISIIAHQCNGGDHHKPTEWLDFSSLELLKKIQLEFLTELEYHSSNS